MLTAVLVTLAAAGLCAAAATPTKVKRADDVKYIVSFGDSYSQTGFDATSTLPSADDDNILGNPAFPGWTTTGGSNYLGYLAATLNTSLTLDYNLASGGATVDADLVTPFAPYPTVHSFIDQLDDLATASGTAAPWTADNSLFSIWFGVNDVGNSYYSDGFNALKDQILDQYFIQVQALYDGGARQFAFLNVPPIQLAPVNLANTDTTEEDAITSINDALATLAADFTTTNTDVAAWVVDTQAPFLEALNNPTKYNATDAECFNEDGVTCLWFNDYHPGQAIHKLVAQAVVDTLREGGSTFF